MDDSPPTPPVPSIPDGSEAVPAVSRRTALTGLGGAATLFAAAACSPGKRASSQPPAEQTVPPTLSGDPRRTIDEQRARIDLLDAQIADLFAQRAIASRNIQL